MHSTNNIEDGYLGSGKRLRYSIRKYGKDNHTKEILEFFESRELLIEAEKKAITPDMISDVNCMNLVAGGCGFTSEYAIECLKKANDKLKILRLDKDWVDRISKILSNSQYKSWADGKRKYNGNFHCDWTGKKHSTQTIKKISESSKGNGTGEANSQYETCWVNNGKNDKKISINELNKYINESWVRGRVKKYSNDLIEDIKEYYKESKSLNKTAIKFNIPKATVYAYVKNK
jgi:hypothetical protein